MAARPSTRPAPRPSATPRPDASGPRPAVRDFTTSQAAAIEWDVRPAYDFLFSLSGDAGSTDDLPEADRRWLADARAALPPDLAASARRLFESELCIHLAGLLVMAPDVRSVAAFTDHVAAMAPRDVIRAICAEKAREPEMRDLLDRALAGDGDAIDALEEHLGDYKKEERVDLLRDPEAAHRDIVAVLSAWAGPFGGIEERVTGILERDYDQRATDRAELTGTDLIEKTTGGIRWMAEPGVRRVVLAPSYFSRPYNFVLAGDDWRFFGYPVADEALDLDDPLAAPLGVMRLHRALGDATRLRILKLLAGRDLYLTEIAQQLDLSKPTIKHHLAQLRVAGLVTVTEAGNVLYYSLRRQRLEDASSELKRFLVD